MAGTQGDGYTKARITVDYSHHEIHAGSHYVLSNYAVIPINNVYDVQWTTPAGPVEQHLIWTISSTDTLTFYIYEGVSILLAGTTLTPYNNNRNSQRTSDAVIAGIANNSVANANLDTATATSTLIWTGRIGSNQVKGASDRPDTELVLRKGTDYCFRALGTAGTTIYFRMSWYEHTPNKKLSL